VTAEFTAEIAEGPAASVDFKSALQEALQARGAPVPEYVVVAEEGPSHRRLFRVQCVIAGRVAAEGDGSSKKAAQQDAARKALHDLPNEGQAT
jgi:ribonuclease-3